MPTAGTAAILAALVVAQSGGPASRPADLESGPSRFRADYSDVALELGFFTRGLPTGGAFTVITPVVKTRIAATRMFAFEAELPFATLDDLPGSQGTSVVGNVSVAGLVRAKPLRQSLVDLGLGLSFPTAKVDQRGEGADRFAQDTALAMTGFMPPYRYRPDLFTPFVPVRFESRFDNGSYVLVDALLCMLVDLGDESTVSGSTGAYVRGGYQPGVFDLFFGLGATAFYGEFFESPGDVEGQVFVEPGIGFLIGPSDQGLRGFRVESRLRLNLDPPAGGGGFDGGFEEGVYGFFVELGYRIPSF